MSNDKNKAVPEAAAPSPNFLRAIVENDLAAGTQVVEHRWAPGQLG